MGSTAHCLSIIHNINSPTYHTLVMRMSYVGRKVWNEYDATRVATFNFACFSRIRKWVVARNFCKYYQYFRYIVLCNSLDARILLRQWHIILASNNFRASFCAVVSSLFFLLKIFLDSFCFFFGLSLSSPSSSASSRVVRFLFPSATAASSFSSLPFKELYSAAGTATKPPALRSSPGSITDCASRGGGAAAGSAGTGGTEVLRACPCGGAFGPMPCMSQNSIWRCRSSTLNVPNRWSSSGGRRCHGIPALASIARQQQVGGKQGREANNATNALSNI